MRPFSRPQLKGWCVYAQSGPCLDCATHIGLIFILVSFHGLRVRIWWRMTIRSKATIHTFNSVVLWKIWLFFFKSSEMQQEPETDTCAESYSRKTCRIVSTKKLILAFWQIWGAFEDGVSRVSSLPSLAAELCPSWGFPLPLTQSFTSSAYSYSNTCEKVVSPLRRASAGGAGTAYRENTGDFGFANVVVGECLNLWWVHICSKTRWGTSTLQVTQQQQQQENWEPASREIYLEWRKNPDGTFARPTCD